MTINTVVSWGATTLSLVGYFLNIKQKKSCFWVWLVANGLWVIYFFPKHSYASVVLFGVYFFGSAWGLIEWKKIEKRIPSLINKNSPHLTKP